MFSGGTRNSNSSPMASTSARDTHGTPEPQSSGPASSSTNTQLQPRTPSPVQNSDIQAQTTASGRSRRSVTNGKRDYRGHPLDQVMTKTGRIKRTKLRASASASGSGIIVDSDETPRKQLSINTNRPPMHLPSPSKSQSQRGTNGKINTKSKKKEKNKNKKQRTFNGKVSMTTRPLNASDGERRGDGLWPDKGENTVKGNMVSVTSILVDLAEPS